MHDCQHVFHWHVDRGDIVGFALLIVIFVISLTVSQLGYLSSFSFTLFSVRLYWIVYLFLAGAFCLIKLRVIKKWTP